MRGDPGSFDICEAVARCCQCLDGIERVLVDDPGQLAGPVAQVQHHDRSRYDQERVVLATLPPAYGRLDMGMRVTHSHDDRRKIAR